MERQLTFAPHGHILTNTGVWSPDGRWIVYDVRSDPAGSRFDGTRIERVNVVTGEVQVLYESKHGACCGVVTCSPADHRVVFIRGPEHPTSDWNYSACHREGVIVDPSRPGEAHNLDARDVVAPFTPGALRGGSHVHVFSGDGAWVSFTYEDAVLGAPSRQGGAAAVQGAATTTDLIVSVGVDRCASHQHQPSGVVLPEAVDLNQRNVGVCVPRSVRVPKAHLRNRDGTHFSVLVTRTVNQPAPGSDEIQRAFEDAWVGTIGYIRTDGTRQKRAIAFQGEVITAKGEAISEVFIADIPDDVTHPGEGPLQGTEVRRPFPPRGTTQRRLTFTAGAKHPGIHGPRHWLRSSPDGSRIAFLMRDDAGVVQLFTVSPNGGERMQVTRGEQSIQSAFTWSPDGTSISCVINNRVCSVDAASGATTALTECCGDSDAPRPEACVFSPDGRRIAFVRQVAGWNQIFVCDAAPAPSPS